MSNIDKIVFVEQSSYLLLEPEWEHAAFGALDRFGAQKFLQLINTNAHEILMDLIPNFFAVIIILNRKY